MSEIVRIKELRSIEQALSNMWPTSQGARRKLLDRLETIIDHPTTKEEVVIKAGELVLKIDKHNASIARSVTPKLHLVKIEEPENTGEGLSTDERRKRIIERLGAVGIGSKF